MDIMGMGMGSAQNYSYTFFTDKKTDWGGLEELQDIIVIEVNPLTGGMVGAFERLKIIMEVSQLVDSQA